MTLKWLDLWHGLLLGCLVLLAGVWLWQAAPARLQPPVPPWSIRSESADISWYYPVMQGTYWVCRWNDEHFERNPAFQFLSCPAYWRAIEVSMEAWPFLQRSLGFYGLIRQCWDDDPCGGQDYL